jgi:FtsH-binding integral membrane protein
MNRSDFIKSVTNMIGFGVLFLITTQLFFGMTGISEWLIVLLKQNTVVTGITMISLILVSGGINAVMLKTIGIQNQIGLAAISLAITSLVFSPFIFLMVGASVVSALLAVALTLCLVGLLKYKAMTYKGDFNMFGTFALYGSIAMLITAIVGGFVGFTFDIWFPAIMMIIILAAMFYEFGEVIYGEISPTRVVPMATLITESIFLLFIQFLDVIIDIID